MIERPPVAATADILPSRRIRRPRRQKVSTTVAQQIVEEISHKRYPAGTKLPSERDMLAQYGVGRSTLREALRFLEMNGVLIVKPGPGGGPIVAEPDAHDLASTLGLFLELNGTKFGSILEVREMLEPAIAGLAAKSASNAIVAGISQSVSRMEANIDDVDFFLEENEHFHQLVAAGADNPIFALLIGSLDRITDGTRLGISFPLQRREAVLVAHRTISVAIEQGDAEAAAASMSRHLRAFRRYTFENYPGAIDNILRWSDIAP
jgi:GntR family transcriptional repressor for pyruvate dehydrogenase complex